MYNPSLAHVRNIIELCAAGAAALFACHDRMFMYIHAYGNMPLDKYALQ